MRLVLGVVVAGLAMSGCSKSDGESTGASGPEGSAEVTKQTVARAEPKPAAELEPVPEPATEPETLLDVPDDEQLGGVAQFSTTDSPGAGDELKVYRQVRSRLRVVHRCYQQARKVDPRLRGKLSVDLTIGAAPEGAVTKVHVVERTIKNYDVEDCVVQTLEGFAFKRAGAEPLQVNLPFIFR